MNTSKNKDPIYDNGWIATFRTAFRTPLPTKPEGFGGIPSKAWEKQHKNLKVAVNIKERKHLHGLQLALNSCENDHGCNPTISPIITSDSSIYVIPGCEKRLVGDEGETLSNISRPGPSTSNLSDRIGSTQKLIKLAAESTSDSEMDDNHVRNQKAYRLYMGENILNHMMINIKNEDYYLCYFKQLIELESGLEKEQPRERNFEIVHPNQTEYPNKSIVKRSSVTGRCQQRNHKTLVGEQNSVNRSKLKKTAIKSLSLQGDDKDQLSDRIGMRIGILADLRSFCNDEELYDSFLKRLIDFEENLLTDNSPYCYN